MRYVKRPAYSRPGILNSPAAEDYRLEVQAFLESGDRERRAPQPPGSILRDGTLYEALARLFEGRCAYCESSLDHPDFGIDHFRPWSGADRGNGQVDFRHYCWLALEWSNLYSACQACLRAKRNFFPIRKTFLDVDHPLRTDLTDEVPILLDPCIVSPADHLRIEMDGEMVGLDEEGMTTVKLLQLNRPALVDQRATELRRLGLATRTILGDNARERLSSAIQRGMPFPGIVLIRLIQALPPGHPFRSWGREPLTLERALRLAEEAAPVFVARPSQPATPADIRSSERRYIRRITVHNFRGIEHAEVEFPPRDASGGKAAGSLALLGENATGKTSFLQAAAIGAIGPAKAMVAGVSPKWCLRDGADAGGIKIEFWDTDDSNHVHFGWDQEVLVGRVEVPVTVLGYGAYRLPARGLLGEARRRQDFRVHTLMEERARVNGPFGLERHLAHVQGEGTAEDAARALNAMLTDAARAHIGHSGRLEIIEAGQSRPLTTLSSGFKSIVSIATDIMDVMYDSWGGISSGQAFVLIDEIDVHLHPEWRIRVVDALRKAFPLTQFLFTTHDPLVLRGLVPEEIRLLDRRPTGELHMATPAIPSLQGLDVDQMLTSDLFGLRTTMNADVERDLKAYYELLAAPHAAGIVDEEADALRERLSFSMPMGSSRRERLLYEIIDRYLARTDGRRAGDVWDEDVVGVLLEEFEAAIRREDGDDTPAE